MSSNYPQKKMMNARGAIDTKGNIVLEQFQDGTALLFQPGNAQPFCVATDYDRATASWSYGKYFSDAVSVWHSVQTFFHRCGIWFIANTPSHYMV